jgi:hypothetical protein
MVAVNNKHTAQPCANKKGEFEMSTETHLTPENQSVSPRSGRLLGGIVLILFGLLILAAKVFNVGLLLIAFPGLAMLALGIATRNSGWLIPAGILNGITLGIVAVEEFGLGAWLAEPAVFMLSFALGWFTIPLFSALFTRERHLWALIPGGVMAVIGGTIAAGNAGLRVLDWFNYLVPAALILVGLLIALRKGQPKT